jgi:hypothetical protein
MPLRRQPVTAPNLVLCQNAVRALQFVAAALAGATTALALMHYGGSKQAAPTFEPDRRQTLVYRQAPLHRSHAHAETAAAFAEQPQRVVPANYPRTVQTIRFASPDSPDSNSIMAAVQRESIPLSVRTVFDPAAMTKVSGFVAFSGKEAAEPAIIDPAKSAAPRRRGATIMDQVDEYLWEVYQRSPTKKDRSGDFTWKDPAAAKRANMSLQDYVIGGMDPDFREALYHAGRAMDAAGIKWTMLSAFRDDYRQRLASGFKARPGNSLHGGSRATGGYGHGRAADITIAEGDADDVWDWLDDNGAKYGLHRPMPSADPAHVQSRGEWRKIATALRKDRAKGAKTKLAKASP